MACSRCLGNRVRAAVSGHALTRTAPRHHLPYSKGHLPRAPGRAGVACLDLRNRLFSSGSRSDGRQIAVRFAAAVLGHLRVRRVDCVSTQHRSFLLASLVPAFLLVSVFAVVQAQNAGSPAASRWSDPATWPDKKVPAKDDVVTIEKDMNVILDVSPPLVHGIKLNGTLRFADNKDLTLTSERILVP